MISTHRISLGLGAALIALLAFVAPVEAQQMKIGVVDMKKVFDTYYKKETADAQIKERAAESEKLYKGMVDDYQKASEEYKKLVDDSNNQAVSADERDKRKKSAEAKLLEMQDIEKQVKAFQAQARTQLGDMEKRMRDKIVGEIRDVVNSKARAGGYTIVFDTAGQSLYQTPLVLFSVPQIELTEDVIKELNANAPAPSAAKTDATSGASNTVPPVFKDQKASPAPADKKKK